MLRYKTETRPGLVALYDIRPGNGAGPFLQPRSPHAAYDILMASRRERNKFCVLYISFIFLQIYSKIPTVLFRYLFHLETAILKL